MLRNNSRLVQNARASLALLALSSVLAACAEPIERRDRGAMIGNQGDAWEALYAPARVDGQPQLVGPEAWRRDTALAGEPEVYTPAGTWDNDTRPRLEDLRRVYIRQRTDEVYYFHTRGGRRPWW